MPFLSYLLIEYSSPPFYLLSISWIFPKDIQISLSSYEDEDYSPNKWNTFQNILWCVKLNTIKY